MRKRNRHSDKKRLWENSALAMCKTAALWGLAKELLWEKRDKRASRGPRRFWKNRKEKTKHLRFSKVFCLIEW
jgi:hypothetical protein